MNVLVACEYSGVVRDAFAKRGHNAWSCDLLPSDAPGNHYEGDALDIINDGCPTGGKWDLLIAHPPCTYLTNSGVSWLHKDTTRWPKLFDGAELFMQFLYSKVERVAVENPIMHKYARSIIRQDYSQIIQPWMFGHMETKATCLWLKGLPNLEPTNNVKEETMALPYKVRNRLHYLPPSPDRWKIRSTTYQGIADAMASQWG